MDGNADLTGKDSTAHDLVDGWEPTHNRSVAGSRPAKPHPEPQVTGLRHLLCLLRGHSLAEAADISASYGRALLADFQADPTLAAPVNGQRSAAVGES